MPVSSSASITIRPEMMCKPPANLRVAETSAFREDVLSTFRRASSSFTCAVNAMAASCHPGQLSGTAPGQLVGPGSDVPEVPLDDVGVRAGQPERVVPRGSVTPADLTQQEARTQVRGARGQRGDVLDRSGIGDDRVDGQLGCQRAQDL